VEPFLSPKQVGDNFLRTVRPSPMRPIRRSVSESQLKLMEFNFEELATKPKAETIKDAEAIQIKEDAEAIQKKEDVEDIQEEEDTKKGGGDKQE